MGSLMTSIRGQVIVAIQEWKCDTLADRDALDKTVIPMGSTAYIIADKTLWMLNSQKQWIQQ